MDFNINNIDIDCPLTWQLLSDGNTKGCFQLESRLGQSMAKKLKPSNIEELAALISIMRPGCLEAVRENKTVSQHFIDKKNHLESIDYFHPALESILNSTYGEMVYQEQAMQIAQKIAGFDLQEADMLRKAIGKKKPEEMAKVKKLFTNGCITSNIVNENEAEQIFGWIEKSQRYSFNKSHAVSYAINAYLSAYCKAHFPKIFFTSYLRYAKDKIDPHVEVKELIANALTMGIDIFPPDIRLMNKDFDLIEDKIRFGITNIKGVGESVYEKIKKIILENKLNLANSSVFEVIFNLLLNINVNAAKALILSGSCDYLKHSRKTMVFYLDILSNLTKKEIEHITTNTNIKNIKDIKNILEACINKPKITKNRQQVILNLVKSVNSPAYSLTDNIEWIAENESYLLGTSITCNKSDAYSTEINTITCKEFKNYKPGKSCYVLGEIKRISVIKTKNGANPGQEMAFIEIGDSTGVIDSAILFPEQYIKYKNFLNEDVVLVFTGTKSKKGDNSLIIEKCFMPES